MVNTVGEYKLHKYWATSSNYMVVALPSLLGLIIFSAALADPLIATKYIKLHRLVIFHFILLIQHVNLPQFWKQRNKMTCKQQKSEMSILFSFTL